MNQHLDARFPLAGALHLRAMQVLNGRSPEQWQADMFALRVDVDALKASLHAQELEEFSDEFAHRLAHDGGWELQFFPDYLRDEGGARYITAEDAKTLLHNWPDPSRLPDGYPDQQFSDLEILEEILLQRRKNPPQGHPTDAQCYALIALEKVFRIDVLFSERSKAGGLEEACLLQASTLAIDAMEIVCVAERELVLARLPANASEQVRKLDAEVQKSVRRAMAKSGAEARWVNDPKTLAKQQVKECWEMWKAAPQNYKSATAFARDMLSKYEELENPDVIRRWCRQWQDESASTITLPPASS